MPRQNFYYPRPQPQPSREDHGQPIITVDANHPKKIRDAFTDLVFRQGKTYIEAANELGIEYSIY